MKTHRKKFIPEAVLLHRGDVICHHGLLIGTLDGSKRRVVSGFREYGVVTSVRRLPDFPSVQDVRALYYGAYRGNIGRIKPYRLRYYNTSLEKVS